jgi:phage shock protein E
VKAIFLLSATCALGLALAGCKSDAKKTTDAATGDAPAPPDVNRQDVASDVLADLATTVADVPGKDATLANDLGKDAAGDLRAPALDLAVGVPIADATAIADTGGEAGCSGWTALKRLSPAEVSSLLATSDPIVINVHIPYAGDISGTDTSISYNNVDAIEACLNYDHCADVLLICLGGGMSQSAGNELIKRGYLRVRDLNGGMQAWEAAGYPLLKDGGT